MASQSEYFRAFAGAGSGGGEDPANPPKTGAGQKFLYLDTVPPVTPTPNAPSEPMKPVPKQIQFKDDRKINPATGKPFKKGPGGKSVAANEDDLRAIVAHAKANGLNPYDALAIAYQETEFGKLDENYGSAWSTYPNLEIQGSKDQQADVLARALKEKFAYAKRLGADKKGEAHSLQVYNGYGVLKPTAKIGDKWQDTSFYEIPVTASNYLDLRENPAYGKTVISLRDEILKKNKELAALVDATPAYGSPESSDAVSQQVRLQRLKAAVNTK